jgi:hypothetical protein
MTSNPCRKVTEEAAQPWQPPLIAMKRVPCRTSMMEIFPPWLAMERAGVPERTNLAVGPASRACVVRSLEDGGHTCEQLRPGGGFQSTIDRRPSRAGHPIQYRSMPSRIALFIKLKQHYRCYYTKPRPALKCADAIATVRAVIGSVAQGYRAPSPPLPHRLSRHAVYKCQSGIIT